MKKPVEGRLNGLKRDQNDQIIGANNNTNRQNVLDFFQPQFIPVIRRGISIYLELLERPSPRKRKSHRALERQLSDALQALDAEFGRAA